MPVSKACKLTGLGAIGVGAILILVVVYSHHRPRICPEEEGLMFKQTGQCYPTASKGPCQHNLVFLPEYPRSQYGQCNCPYNRFNRTLLYHQDSQRCYFVFTQAYCSEGHWLTLKRDGPNKGKAICEENKCLQHAANGLEDAEGEKHSFDYQSVEWVPLKGGGCAELGSHVENCPEGSVVRFHKGYINPSCREPPRASKGAAVGVPAAPCSLGSFPSIMGKCQPEFDFDFE